VEHLNPSPRREPPSQQAVEVFKSKHQLEYAIYEWASSLNRLP